MKTFSLFLLCCASSLYFLTNNVYAQSPTAKFGDITLSELKNFPDINDTTAEAVILFDIGHFYGNQINFTRHLRIKILKNSGTQWGNWVINTPSKSNIKAVVFNLENGLLVKEKLENSSIYEEQLVNNYYVYKIFAPKVKVGSVIDLYYNHPGIPFEWRFQERIPVVYSELTLEGSPYISYSKTQFGFEPIHQVSPSKWVASNMPAFKMEPYLTNYSNYITKLYLQVTSVDLKGRFFDAEFSTSWKVINNLLLHNPRFGDILDYSAFLNGAAKEIKEKESSAEKRIALAYDYIQENIKWNGISSLLASKDYSTNFRKSHSGNCADINLHLIALLNKIGIQTSPVVLSTRDNGLLIHTQPTINKLNYVIARVNHEGLEMLLDATSDKLIPGILPDRCLNGSGLIVEMDKENMIDLTTKFIKRKKQYIKIHIDKGGTAKANILQHYDQYAYLEWLASNETETEEQKHVKMLEKNYPNLKILTYEIENSEPEKLSADEKMEVDLSGHITELDGELLFSPFILSDHQENLFKLEERKYPVDLVYPSEFSSTVVVNIPEEYKIKTIPEPLMLATTDRSVTLKILSGIQTSQIQFQMNLKITKSIFTEEEYKELRLFYSHLIKKIKEPILLVKTY